MIKDLKNFIKSNKKPVSTFVVWYVGINLFMKAVTFISELNPKSLLINSIAAASLLGTFVLLLLRMNFYFTIVKNYKKTPVFFNRATLDTIWIYLKYFFKSMFFFLPVTIIASIVYLNVFPFDSNLLLESYELSEEVLFSAFNTYLDTNSFKYLSVGLMCLFQILYAVLTFKIIFIPHINSAVAGVSYRDKEEVSKKLIPLNTYSLKYFYLIYQAIKILIAIFVVLFTQKTIALLFISFVLMIAEILWSIIVSWQFIRIDENKVSDSNA